MEVMFEEEEEVEVMGAYLVLPHLQALEMLVSVTIHSTYIHVADTSRK